MCDHQEKENKHGKTTSSKSQHVGHHRHNHGHRHQHHHHKSCDNVQDFHSAGNKVFSDHQSNHQIQCDNDKTHSLHRHHYHHKPKPRHVSLSETSSGSSSTSSLMSSSSSSFSSPSSSSSSSSSSFSSSSTSSSTSSLLSSENSSECSDRYVLQKPRYSQSCIDISGKHKDFEEGDDTVPLINERSHLNMPSTKPKPSKSSHSGPIKGTSKNKQRVTQSLGKNGSFRKAKSMDDLTTPKDKDGNGSKDEKEQERYKMEAKKNMMKEKMNFSAFLNEITRQVLSPMRLTSLGVTDAQRPSSPRQVPARSKETESCTEKHSQQRSRPTSADSVSSGKRSRTSKHSHSSGRSHSKSSHHSDHHSPNLRDHEHHRPRSSHSCSPTHEHHSRLPSRKHHHHHPTANHPRHHHEDSKRPSHHHHHRHHRSPANQHRDHHGLNYYGQDHQNPSHCQHCGDHHSPTHQRETHSHDHYDHGHEHHHGACHAHHHDGNQNPVPEGHHISPYHHEEHQSSGHNKNNLTNSRPTTPHHCGHSSLTSDQENDHSPTHQHHHGDQHKEHHQHHHGDQYKEHHQHHHGDHTSEPHHPHQRDRHSPNYHHRHGDHYTEIQQHHHEHQHSPNSQHHSRHHHKESQHHHRDHHEDHHGPGHPHHYGDLKSEPHGHHHRDHHSPGHCHGEHQNEAQQHHHGEHHSEAHHHHHHRGHHSVGHHHHHVDKQQSGHHHHGDHQNPGNHHYEDHHSEVHHHHHGNHHSPGHHHHHGDHHSEPHHNDHEDHHNETDQHHHRHYHGSGHGTQHHHGDYYNTSHHQGHHPESQQPHHEHDKDNNLDHESLHGHHTFVTGHSASSPLLHGKPECLVNKPDSPRNIHSPTSQNEEKTSFTGPSSHKENAHELGRIKIVQDQNEGLHQSLLKTAVRMECLGEEFMSSQKLLETELQKTRTELSDLMEKFKRLHETCSSTQQTNNLLEQKLQSVAESMEGERVRLNRRISELTEQLTDAKIASSMEVLNVTSVLHKTNLHSQTDGAVIQMVPSIAPPPVQFMDSQSYGKDKASVQEQPLGSVPEEEESDWSEVGEETPRLIMTGSNRGQVWRRQEADMDKDSESGGEDVVRPHSPRPLQIPHLQFTVHNDFMSPSHNNSCPSAFKNLSDRMPGEESYRITKSPNLGSILIRSASLEEIPLAHHHMQKELRGTEAMMDLHHSGDEAIEVLDNEIIHHWRMSNARDTVMRGMTDSNLSSLQSAEQMLNHLLCDLPSSQGREPGVAEVHGWSGGIPEEVLKGERTQL